MECLQSQAPTEVCDKYFDAERKIVNGLGQTRETGIASGHSAAIAAATSSALSRLADCCVDDE